MIYGYSFSDLLVILIFAWALGSMVETIVCIATEQAEINPHKTKGNET